jgi:DNA-binding NarL/FixJ family response regulator
MTDELNVLIADDHELIRHGVRRLIEAQKGWRVVAEASNGSEAIRLAQEHSPDMAILDLAMPECNGLEATRRLRMERPDLPVLILTMHESEQATREILAAGARGYVLKSDAARDLIAAIQSLREQKPFFTAHVSKLLIDTCSIQNTQKSFYELSPREREVLRALGQGKTNREISDDLGIGVKTVETHRANLMHKLQLQSLTELVHYAIRNHIVDPWG